MNTLKTPQVYDFTIADTFERIIPVTDIKKNISTVLTRLEKHKSLFITKNSSVLGVLVEKTEFENIDRLIKRQALQIEELNDQLAVLIDSLNPEDRLTEPMFLKAFKERITNYENND